MTAPSPDALAFLAAVKIEPQLAALEKFVADCTRGDLPSVENWCLRFNRIFGDRPALQPYRKSTFAHLLVRHNQAIAERQDGAP